MGPEATNKRQQQELMLARLGPKEVAREIFRMSPDVFVNGALQQDSVLSASPGLLRSDVCAARLTRNLCLPTARAQCTQGKG